MPYYTFMPSGRRRQSSVVPSIFTLNIKLKMFNWKWGDNTCVATLKIVNNVVPQKISLL